MAGYCATKGGVRLFAKAVAMECAVEPDGIRVNTIHPGVIDTPIWTKLPASAGSNAPIDPNEVAKAGVPFGRAGQAQDIANGVLFLASDASSYMTGAELSGIDPIDRWLAMLREALTKNYDRLDEVVATTDPERR